MVSDPQRRSRPVPAFTGISAGAEQRVVPGGGEEEAEDVRGRLRPPRRGATVASGRLHTSPARSVVLAGRRAACQALPRSLAVISRPVRFRGSPGPSDTTTVMTPVSSNGGAARPAVPRPRPEVESVERTRPRRAKRTAVTAEPEPHRARPGNRSGTAGAGGAHLSIHRHGALPPIRGAHAAQPQLAFAPDVAEAASRARRTSSLATVTTEIRTPIWGLDGTLDLLVNSSPRRRGRRPRRRPRSRRATVARDRQRPRGLRPTSP